MKVVLKLLMARLKIEVVLKRRVLKSQGSLYIRSIYKIKDNKENVHSETEHCQQLNNPSSCSYSTM